MYIQANIGRNVGTEPMRDDAWETFQQDVKEEIFLAIHDTSIATALDVKMADFQVHTGMGEWDGVKEESAHVSLYYADQIDTPDAKAAMVEGIRVHLENRLSYLAFQYGQDAIAFVVTDSHLATRG